MVRLPRGGVEEFKQAEHCIAHAVVHAVVHATVHAMTRISCMHACACACFEQAAARLDAVSAAALAVSLCVGAGSAALAPLALLGGFVQRALAGAEAEMAGAFVLSALSALPAELRAAVGGGVFLEPARAVLPDACRALLALADAAQRRMLHRLGGWLGQTELTRELAATLFEPPMPPPAVKHTGGTPSTFLVSAPAAPLLPPMSNGGGLPKAESEPTNQTPDETQPTQPTSHVDTHGSAAHGAASGEICARVAAKYGVGLDSSAESVEVRSSLGNLQDGLMRSIHRLAAELYSGNVHFVLELVQNADDNAYTPGVVPTLRIVARREQIVFENNEAGFAERHVLAICSMGESTKQASDAGYIGNKGIGFKSVFKLTATPEVHSRDYHIRFDSSDGGGLGYIVPKPIAEPAGWDASHGTAIVLPLAASGAAAILREFRVHLHEIKPTLLLFLHRLHRLVACDELGGVVRTMERRAEEEDAAVTVLTETTETTGGALPPTTSTQRWLVIKRSLDVSQLERDGILATEITLAFPLRDPSHGHGGTEAERVAPPPALDVFAYLPLRSYGLRFLLQADWMVPSSREAVDASSPWNQFIRDRVPALLRQAADEFVVRASALLEVGDTAGAAHLMSLFLEALPVAGQVVEFFAPLAGAAAAALRGCSCVLTADGRFVLPCEALLNELQQDATATGQTTQALVQELSLSHAHPELRLPPAVAAALGVRRLDAVLLCELLGALSQRWHAAADVDLEYMAWAFELLQRDAQCGASLHVVRRLRLLPLADGSLGSTEQEPVYELASALRPLAPRLEGLTSLGPARRGLHPRLAELAATRRDVGVMLARLRVQRLEPAALLTEHVLPALAAAQTPDRELPRLLWLARACSGGQPEGMLERQLIEAGVRLLACDAKEARLGPQLQLSLPEPSFVPEPPPGGWRLLDEKAYLAEDNNSSVWRGLFRGLGVDSFPAIVPAGSDGDWHSPPMEALLAALSSSALGAGDSQRCLHFFHALRERWPRVRSRCERERAQEQGELQLTSLGQLLRTYSWLPGSDGQLHAPTALWVRSLEAERLLGRNLLFGPEMPEDMARVLGLCREPTPAVVLSLMEMWATYPRHNASVEQMAELYAWLMRAVHVDAAAYNATAAEVLRGRLATMRWLWVPDAGTVHGERRFPTARVVPGAFFFAKDVAWQDPAQLIDSRDALLSETVRTLAIRSSGLRVLHGYYEAFGALEAPLVACGVAAQPQLRHHVAIMRAVAAAGPPSLPDIVASLRVMRCLAADTLWGDGGASDVAARVAAEEEAGESAGGQLDRGESALRLRGDQLRAHQQAVRREQLAAALEGAAVFPVYARAGQGRWASLDELLFYVEAPPQRGARSAEVASWSGAVLSHVAETRPPVSHAYMESSQAEVEDALLVLFRDVLRLCPLGLALRDATIITELQPVSLAEPACASVRVCAAAGALQRWSQLKYMAAEQCDTVAALLRAMQLRHVDEVTVWREARHPSSGALLERVPALRPGEQAYSCYLHLPKGGAAEEAGPPLLLLTAQVSCVYERIACALHAHDMHMHAVCTLHARCMHTACSPHDGPGRPRVARQGAYQGAAARCC